MRSLPISDTALTRETAIAIAETGLPTTFVPGRNLIFFCFAGALAYRRGARHLVAGMCETDYSGYPDCRDDTIKAMQVALSLGLDKRVTIHTPLMWIDKADTFAMAEEIGGKAFLDLVIEESHSCYLGDRTQRHAWGYGCGECPACQLRAQGFEKFSGSKENDERRWTGAKYRRLYFSRVVLPHHSGGQLDDWPRGNRMRPHWPVSGACRARHLAPSGVLMIGVALVLRDLVQRRLGVEFGIGAIIVGAAISAGLAPPSLVVASAAAFLLSEFADFAVYTPLARRRLVLAVIASSIVGLIVELDRISVARLRFARVPDRSDRRQTLDGPARDSLCRRICAAATNDLGLRLRES